MTDDEKREAWCLEYKAKQAAQAEKLNAKIAAVLANGGKSFTELEEKLMKALFHVVCDMERTVSGEWGLGLGEQLPFHKSAYQLLTDAGLTTWTRTRSEFDC